MFYFFYGEDTFSLRQKVGLLKGQILNKAEFPPEMFVLKGENLTRSQYEEAVFAVSIFSAKKIVEIRNVLTENKDKNLAEYIGKSLDKIPESVLVIFSESGVPDKRGGLFKKLNILKRSQEFKPPEGAKLVLWIKERADKCGITIGAAAIDKLINYVGPDLWRLNNEIEKLALFVIGLGKEEVEVSAVEEMVETDINETNFDLIDALALKNGQRVLSILNNLLNDGANEVAILGMIVYQYRTMLSVSPYFQKGELPAQIARQLKIHPFVVSKTLNFLKRTDYEELIWIYDRLAETDTNIKTGQIEARLGLDLLLADICRK